jgi:hypothetical protein
MNNQGAGGGEGAAAPATASTAAWQTKLMMNGIGDLFGGDGTGSSEQNDIESATFQALSDGSQPTITQSPTMAAVSTNMFPASLDFLKGFSNGALSTGFPNMENALMEQQQQVMANNFTSFAASMPMPPPVEVKMPEVSGKTNGKITGRKRKATGNALLAPKFKAEDLLPAPGLGGAGMTVGTGSLRPSSGKHANETIAEKQERVRQRNRVHARSCRIRKRQALETLKTRVQSLEGENNTLKQAFRVLYNQKELTTAMVISEFGEKGVLVLEKLRRSFNIPQHANPQ